MIWGWLPLQLSTFNRWIKWCVQCIVYTNTATIASTSTSTSTCSSRFSALSTRNSAHDVSFVNERDFMAFRLRWHYHVINEIRTIIRLHDKAMEVEIQKDDLIFVNPFDDFMLIIIIQLNFISVFIRLQNIQPRVSPAFKYFSNISFIQRRYDVGLANKFRKLNGAKLSHKPLASFFSLFFPFGILLQNNGALVLIVYQI